MTTRKATARATATANSNSNGKQQQQLQIPFGDDNQKGNNNGNAIGWLVSGWGAEEQVGTGDPEKKVWGPGG